MTEHAAVQVIGFGAAALGFPIAAERLGVLDAWLGAGAVFIDREGDVGRLARERLAFTINSNSLGGDFVNAIPISGIFADLGGTTSFRRLVESWRLPVPLWWVTELFSEVQARIVKELDRYPRCRLETGRNVACVQLDRRETFTSYDQHGAAIASSRSIVFANGADERSVNTGPTALTLLAGQLLKRDWGDLPQLVAAGAPIQIVGGSHSGFSAAVLLRDAFAGVLKPGQITVVCRRVKLYYESMHAAALDRYAFRPEELDPETFQLNRFDGLRGEAKVLHGAIASGQEARVRVCAAAPPVVDPKRVVVLATGYETRRIPLIDADGRDVQVSSVDGKVDVNDCGQLLDTRGRGVPNTFGIGIGYAPSNRVGAREVSIGLFHGKAAERILRAIHRTDVRNHDTKPSHGSEALNGDRQRRATSPR